MLKFKMFAGIFLLIIATQDVLPNESSYDIFNNYLFSALFMVTFNEMILDKDHLSPETFTFLSLDIPR